MALNFMLPSPETTELLGQALASGLPGTGCVLYLHGELGAGKTTLVRALLRELGVKGTIKSPTYALVESYQIGGLDIAHVDLYRLSSEGQVTELALHELWSARTLMLIEWPERAARLPTPDVELTLGYRGSGRQGALVDRTPTGAGWLDKLRLDTRLQSYLSNLT